MHKLIVLCTSPEGLRRQRKQIGRFFSFILLFATVALVLADLIVEPIVQFIQLAVELAIGEEIIAADAAIVVSVCLLDQAFG